MKWHLKVTMKNMMNIIQVTFKKRIDNIILNMALLYHVARINEIYKSNWKEILEK